jgi:large subunit ribosomal protein L23
MTALFGKNKSAKEGKKEEKKIKKSEETADVRVGEDNSADRQEKQPEIKIPKGGDDHAYSVIIAPHMTEKASLETAKNKYTFKVAKNASKIEVKKAIEKMYKVKVKNVSITMKPNKIRRIGRNEGIKAGFKKAIVTLVEGDKIDIVS